ncbi:serine O-acetyltransferase [Exiguobacterium alkaliphilum]|uniref:serine O-acetyltransferase n=1 Tax=Exiguobacterium alkaliphilum TaxID=1428684 RepID=UPI003464942C
MKFSVLKNLIKEDFSARFHRKITKKMFFKSVMADLNFRVVVLIRIQHYFYENGTVRGRLIATFLRNCTIKKYGVEVGNKAKIGSGLNIHHINGVVIGEQALIGKNLNIYQNVTIGSIKGKYPVIGDNVSIFPGAIVIGNITIGSHSKIGPNVVVKESIEENTILYIDNKVYQGIVKK